MNYTLLIIIAIAGVGLGYYFGMRRHKGSLLSEPSSAQGYGVAKQSEEKERNKRRILEHMQVDKEVSNDEIEKLLGVSDSTATRYMKELEEEGKVRQVGEAGRFVHYVLK